MRPTVIIVVNGILNNPSDQQSFTDEMTSVLNRRTPAGVKVEKFEYFCSAVFRWLGQRKRAAELARRVLQYANEGWRVVMIGHSNGCDLIARVLLMGVKIDSCHLFAPATDEGHFAIAIGQRLVRRIHIYGSPDDRALSAATWSQRLFGWLGLGYGSMGLRGPAFAASFANVFDHSIPGYGHSTWFKPGAHFQGTVDMILANDLTDLEGLAA